MLKLRRLIESDEQLPVMPEMPTMHAQTPPEGQLQPAPMEQPEALPTPAQSTVPVDPMTMTVKDFLNKCNEVDPLVCMGIKSFIEKNTGAFGADQMKSEPDLTFSTAIQPQAAPQAPAQVEPFSLDQAPETLDFPA